jgi:rod shape-determining protein MreC
MGNTEYRGKIIWFLITCRPDLLPIDLKRQGRAEEHLALFYPDSVDEKAELFRTLQRKLDNKVKEGDPVVTSYVSDRYQQGILIGYVTKIENNSNNLTKSGTITPVVDFEHIENVMVITQLKQTGDTKTADDTESTKTAGDSQTENSTENK